MNKKLEKSLVDYGLTMTDKNKAYGVKNGYEISVSYNAFDNVSPVHIHIACYTRAGSDGQQRYFRKYVDFCLYVA